LIPRSVTMYVVCNIELFKVSHEVEWKTSLRLGGLRNEAAPTGCWGRAAMGIGLLSETAGCANACRPKIARYVDAIVLSRYGVPQLRTHLPKSPPDCEIPISTQPKVFGTMCA
jgi:hypothetical protein